MKAKSSCLQQDINTNQILSLGLSCSRCAVVNPVKHQWKFIHPCSQPARGGCQLPARAAKKSPGDHGEGKILPRCSTPCPAQHPPAQGAPQEGAFLDFQEKSHGLPAEELQCRHGCSQHSPAHVGACLCAKEECPGDFGQGSWPCLPFFHGDSLCWVQQSWDGSQGAPARLGGLSGTSHPAWQGTSLPRQRNPPFTAH